MAKKDSYWFKHDSDAGRDLKMLKLKQIYGHWGVGVFWEVCEILRKQTAYRFESDESSLQLLSGIIGVNDTSKFFSWFHDCVRLELFIIENNMFFSKVFCENMQSWEILKSNGSKGGRPKGNQNETRGVTKVKTKTKPKRNQTHNHKEKINKINISFSDFWDAYGKKVGNKDKSERLWMNLTDEERQSAIDKIKPYQSSIQDRKFIVYPERYLDQKRWKGEFTEQPIQIQTALPASAGWVTQ